MVFHQRELVQVKKDKNKFKINYSSIPKIISGNNKHTAQRINEFYKLIF